MNRNHLKMKSAHWEPLLYGPCPVCSCYVPLNEIINMIKAFCFTFLLLGGAFVHASNDQQDEDAGFFVAAKMAGACGIMDEMIHFQSKTKMEGGEMFVTRFWAVEAARLGMTVQELSVTCTASINTYDQILKQLTNSKK